MSAAAPPHRADGPDGAPAVVLANSMGTALSMWDPQVPALAERFRVLRYDHPGHGLTPAAPGPYRLDDFGGAVLGLLDRLGLRRVSFCGLSLGGMVGLWLAAHAPDRIDRLALLCTSAHLPPAQLWHDRAETVRTAGTSAVAEELVTRWFTAGFGDRHPDVVARLVSDLNAVDDESYAACCELIAGLDQRPVLGRIVAPTLVVAGADDPATPPAHAEVIAAGVPAARLAVLPRAAHLANLEQPDEITALLLDHLDGDRGGRAGWSWAG